MPIRINMSRFYDIFDDAVTPNLLKNHQKAAYLLPTRVRGFSAGVGMDQTLLWGDSCLFADQGPFIIFMLRKVTCFQQVRDSMLQLVKKSTASTDSRGEADEPKLLFYRSFLRQAPAMACRISRVETMPKIGSERTYAVYCISVRTNVVQYEIKKRYTQFQKLYIRCMKLEKIAAIFPPRTIFQAGWSEEVTAQRMTLLNKLLEEISNCNASEQIKFQLYDFLNLYDKYQKERVQEIDTGGEIVTDEFLLTELAKLNDSPNNVLDSLNKIKLSVSQRKKRLGYEVARQLFTGFNDYSGIISIALGSENELVVMRGLQLINWLISAETHRDYELFRRMLFKCLPSDLIIEGYDQLRSHCELTAEYFKLIKQYLSARQEDIQCIAKFYECGQSMEEEYSRWLKYSNLDSRS